MLKANEGPSRGKHKNVIGFSDMEAIGDLSKSFFSGLMEVEDKVELDD